jgi:hypothetical protein
MLRSIEGMQPLCVFADETDHAKSCLSVYSKGATELPSSYVRRWSTSQSCAVELVLPGSSLIDVHTIRLVFAVTVTL